MKHLPQLCIIFLFSFLGEVCHYLIPAPIPASIYGMVLLFAALALKLIPVKLVKDAGSFLTGILGNIMGPGLCKLLRLRSPIAQGVAFGTASHVIGTSRAVEMSRTAGAVSSLSLTIAGLFTALTLSFLAQYV